MAVRASMPMNMHVNRTVFVRVNVGMRAMAEGLLQAPSKIDQAKSDKKPARHRLAWRIQMQDASKDHTERGAKCS